VQFKPLHGQWGFFFPKDLHGFGANPIFYKDGLLLCIDAILAEIFPKFLGVRKYPWPSCSHQYSILSINESILSTIFIFTAKALGELDSSTAPMQSQRVVMTIISESMRAWTWASSLGALVEGMGKGVVVGFGELVRL
jgi:hypothetical protein